MGGRGSSGGTSGGGGGGRAVDAKMPELTGSAKQVSWAESIRHDALSAVDGLTNNYKRIQSQAKQGDNTLAEDTLGYNLKDVASIRSQVVSNFQNITSASKIIDLRRNFTSKNFEELARSENKRKKK